MRTLNLPLMNEKYFELIMAELLRLNSKIDTRIDDLRSEMKTGFADVRNELRAEMKTGFAEARKDTAALRHESRTCFNEVRRDLEVIREQTALNSEEIAALDRRTKKTPSA
jgi:hypothetical protein